MKTIFLSLVLMALYASCSNEKNDNGEGIPIQGTWQLLSGTLIEKGDTTVNDYTKDIRMIKIINASHFSFLNHDLNKGADSAAAVFVAGGGRYTLKGDQYTESLEYCTDRAWEGHDFQFTIEVKNDTLIQKGIEKLERLGIERLNTEVYVKVK
jgi:hypothetical protein